MKKAGLILFFIIIIVNISFANENVILSAAKKELDRSLAELKNDPNPPYFISYGISDVETVRISASLGKIKSEVKDKSRILDVDLRVGSYKFDNSHIFRGNNFSFGGGAGRTNLPIENNEMAIRNAIWSATDRAYKNAIKTYNKVMTNQAVKVKEEDSSADFSREQPNRYVGKKENIKIDLEEMKVRLRNLSSRFSKYKWLYKGNVTFNSEIRTKYLINSEGSELVWHENYIRIFVDAKTKADDGMSLPLFKSYFAFSPEGLPDDKTIVEDIENMINLLDELRKAPSLQTTYSGPAILSGEASGVFFHEIFGHRVEGHREKDPNSSQTFKNSADKKILPDFISVIMDPTLKTLADKEISGYYLYDDEGVKSQRVLVAEDGKFKNFLMSRSPIENYPKSNGHGRRQAGYKAVSRQSNLIVEAKNKVSTSQLRDMLIEECKKQDKEYGLYFGQVQGGFTFTGRSIPNAFNVNPLLVWKIFVDGRPDELIRGVDLIGTPLATFANITTAGDDLGIFNGICGAESGGVPVSASSPSLLVSLIEVQKKAKSQAKPPILPAP